MKNIFIIFIILLSVKLNSQNLIPNSDFETFNHCNLDVQIGTLFVGIKKLIPEWYVPTKGSPDYYNNCSNNSSFRPPNIKISGENNVYVKKGEGMVGLIVGHKKSEESYTPPDFREYLGVKLIKPLEKDTLYILKLNYQLSPNSSYGIKKIQIGFSKRKISKFTEGIIKSKNLNIVDVELENNDGWACVQVTYKALGEEKFITFGNFKSNLDTNFDLIRKSTKKKKYSDQIYYFFDSFYLDKQSNDDFECIKGELKIGNDTVNLNKEFLIENKDSIELDLVINELKKKLIEQEQLFIILNGRDIPAKKVREKLLLVGVLHKQIKINESNNQLTFKLTFEK